jgi:DNA (cytosine-5)-methyltransferase 1
VESRQYLSASSNTQHNVAGVHSPPTFIDLFAGCGGLSLGLLNAGWRGLFAVERDEFAFSTLKTNLIEGSKCSQIEWPDWIPAGKMAIRTFLQKLRDDKKLFHYLHGIDLVAGGPPCQGFSFAGKRRHDDPRNVLFRDYLKVVALLRPKLLLIENVSGILVEHKKKRIPFAEKIRRRLQRLGYATFAEVHRASEFGVPQERPRYVLVGIDRKQAQNLPDWQYEAFVENSVALARLFHLMEKKLFANENVNVRDAISDLQVKGRSLKPCSDAPNRSQIKYREPRTLTPYQAWLRRDAPPEMNSMRLARHAKHVEKKFRTLIRACKAKDRRGVALNVREREPLETKKRNVVVLDPNKPSHTLTTLPDDLLHYEEPRILTVREYARLQSFPDWYEFCGKYTTGGEMRRKECPRYTQAGNAVAPFVAEVMGRALTMLLREIVDAE